MNKSGIYKITNIINSKIYIGSAVNLNRRKNDHIRDLKNNRHCNSYLQKAYNKYNVNSFTFEIIEECSKDILIEREQYYIDTLNPHYNICKKAGNILGIKRSKETCEKLSKSNIGKKQSIETRRKQAIIKLKINNKESLLIFQYDMNNNLINKYLTSSLAAEDNKIKASAIRNCLCGLSKKAGGYIWKYESEVTFE